MNFSCINHLIYTMNLDKQSFVIGGMMAAGLSEPEAAKVVDGSHTEVHVSSTIFHALIDKDNIVQLDKDTLRVNMGGYHSITIHHGLPMWWVAEGGYRVIKSSPLKRDLINSGRSEIAALIQDEPFEVRMKAVVLTEAEVAFEEACKRHDWYWSYSDDNSVWRKGRDNLKTLEETRDQLGANAKLIFDKYSSR